MNSILTTNNVFHIQKKGVFGNDHVKICSKITDKNWKLISQKIQNVQNIQDFMLPTTNNVFSTQCKECSEMIA